MIELSVFGIQQEDFATKPFGVTRVAMILSLMVRLHFSSFFSFLLLGQQIISAHTDKALRFWDVATGKAIHEATDLHNLQISGLALSPGISFQLTSTLLWLNIRWQYSIDLFER